MNSLFDYVLNYYLDGEKYDNKDKKYHKLLKKQIPNYIKSLVGSKYTVKGSCGASYKAEVPWIGVFNPDITTTAKYGIYIVYLFKTDMSGFYLCLGQGITNFKKYGKLKNEIMLEVANYYKDHISTYFNKDIIDLAATTSNGKGYEKVNILNKYYDKQLIETYNFEQDLKDMLKIYEELAEEMKYQTYDDVIENLISNTNPNYISEQEAIRLIDQAIIESTNSNEVELTTLKQVDIPEGKRKTKYSEMSKKTVRKVDYIKKQKKNASNGLIGEKLVMLYEEEKLRSCGREDLINKINWIGKVDDSAGYDILSFDKDGNEIYIEVKSTEGNDQSTFFISANEMNVMEKFKNQYFIYRVYNLRIKEPELYILNYNDFKSKIDLQIDGYMASLKGE